MHPTGTRLDSAVPIAVLTPLRATSVALLELLRSFTEEDWRKPTVHPDRDVKDLTAHLLLGAFAASRACGIATDRRLRPFAASTISSPSSSGTTASS
jgi:hypothetical protein